jgi:glycosyltransferase involved in cell wall biosynthesis
MDVFCHTKLVHINAIGFGNYLTPSTRYRLLQFIPWLEIYGIFISYKSSKDLSGFCNKIMFFLSDYGNTDKILIIQKKLFPIWWLWIASKKYEIIFDFDDAIWTTEKVGRSKLTNFRARNRLKYTLRISKIVTVGNHYLADFASKYAKKITVLPTVIDTLNFPLKLHSNGEFFTIGWIGQSVNFKYLKKLKEVFYRLSSKIKFKLLVIADRGFEMDGVDVINIPWSLETEISDILKMDIGIMPLDESEWTNGKCAFKAIQYMAAGIPAVASHVGANIDLITHGVDGYLTKTTDDWVSCISKLAKDPLLRECVGLKARNTIDERYSIKDASVKLSNAIRNL